MIRIVPKTPGIDALGSAAKQWAEVRAVSVFVNGVAAARVNRPLDQFGEPSDNTDLDATTTRHGLMPKSDKIKLNGIAADAQVNPTAAAIASAYAGEVPQVSAPEKADPASYPTVRRSSPADIAAIADVRIAAAAILGPAAAVSAVAADTNSTDTVVTSFSGGKLAHELRRKTAGLALDEGEIGKDSAGAFVRLGSGAGAACAGNDPRLPTTDQRAALANADNPTPGNPFQTLSGAKTIPLDQFGEPSDSTALDATPSRHGLMPKADKEKLDALESLTPEGIKSAYESNANTNAFTDAEKAKLGDLPPTGYTLPAPTETELGGVKRNAGSPGQFVNGISAAGDLLYGSPPSLVPDVVRMHDQKSSGTHGGDATAGTWHHRALNQKSVDTGGICTLSANQFSLPAGTYEIAATAPGYYVAGHKLRLFNVTAGVTVSGLVAPTSRSGDGTQTDALLSGRFSLGATATLRLEHHTTGTRTNGLGLAASISGETEVYAAVELRKIA